MRNQRRHPNCPPPPLPASPQPAASRGLVGLTGSLLNRTRRSGGGDPCLSDRFPLLFRAVPAAGIPAPRGAVPEEEGAFPRAGGGLCSVVRREGSFDLDELGSGSRRSSMGDRLPGYRDRGPGEPGKYGRPPRSHGGGNMSVPLWEKKFCTDACAIPWGKLCETKKLMSLYKNVVDWDDSAGLEAFKDAKARFCALYHGQPCDIPLPDPNMYIEMVNADEHVDPEMVADLEKSRRAVPKRDNDAPDSWDSFIFADKPVPATGWGDGETSNTPGQQCSVNWDNLVEQPIEANCKRISGNWDNHVNQPAQTIVQQSSGNWDNHVNQPAQTIVQQSSGNWDMYVEQQGQTSNWGEPTMPCTWGMDMKGDSLDAWKCGYGWGSAAIDSWDNRRDIYNMSDEQGWSYGHWRRQNNESSRRSSRNRDRGGPISSKVMKSKYHAEEHSGSNNGWRHCRVRNNMHYAYENPGCNQPLAM